MTRVGIVAPKSLLGELDSLGDLDYLVVPGEEYIGHAATGDLGLLREYADRFPLHLHTTSLSVCSYSPLADEFVAAMHGLCESLEVESISDHLGFNATELSYTGTPVINPEFSDRSIALTVDRLTRFSDLLGSPVMIENGSYCIDWPGSVITEGKYVEQVLQLANSYLVLDITNLIGRSRVTGESPLDLLHDLPLSRVRQIHLAGGDWLDDYSRGTIGKAHSLPIRYDSWDLARTALQSVGPVDITIEWTRSVDVGLLRRDIEKARALIHDAGATLNRQDEVVDLSTYVDTNTAREELTRTQTLLLNAVTGAQNSFRADASMKSLRQVGFDRDQVEFQAMLIAEYRLSELRSEFMMSWRLNPDSFDQLAITWIGHQDSLAQVKKITYLSAFAAFVLSQTPDDGLDADVVGFRISLQIVKAGLVARETKLSISPKHRCRVNPTVNFVQTPVDINELAVGRIETLASPETLAVYYAPGDPDLFIVPLTDEARKVLADGDEEADLAPGIQQELEDLDILGTDTWAFS